MVAVETQLGFITSQELQERISICNEQVLEQRTAELANKRLRPRTCMYKLA